MTDPDLHPRWRPTKTNVVAGGLVVAGLALTGLNWWFLLLTAIGTLGPGVLRELGWLNDRDEFQRRADHRAGYLAFLATGLVAFLFVAFFRTGGTMESAHRLATLFLSLLWFVWLISSLIAFWGAQRAAAWLLRIFGTVVLAFTIVSNLGSEWTGWTALLLHPLLALPFFALAWLSARAPRVTGVLLLGSAAFFLLLFGAPARGFFEFIGDGVVPIFFLGPLVAGGVALLFVEKEIEDRGVAPALREG